MQFLTKGMQLGTMLGTALNIPGCKVWRVIHLRGGGDRQTTIAIMTDVVEITTVKVRAGSKEKDPETDLMPQETAIDLLGLKAGSTKADRKLLSITNQRQHMERALIVDQ